MDRGLRYQGYHVDEARTFVVGKPNSEQERCYDAVKRILDCASSVTRPGVSVAKIYNTAAKKADELGYYKYFMTRAFYDVEFLGHGIGLEMDEPPIISPGGDMILLPGMVLAYEPKIIIPNWGGLGLEDTILVTEHGMEFLTTSSRDLIVV